ncbi:MAG: hypothetical protein PHY94_02710 [Candidatus Omnitrophica bacterium]|nr:hypothetical protein [Candidatus Omnitrophota bacterium]
MQRIITKREKIILYLAAGVVIFSLVFNFALSPIVKKNELLNQQITVTRGKLKKYLWLLSQKESIQKKQEKAASADESLLTGKDTLVTTLSELERLTKEANIRIVDIRPQTSKNLDLYKELIIDLRTEGDLEGYIKFIYSLENSLSLLKIKKLDLNVKPDTQSLEGVFAISKLSID